MEDGERRGGREMEGKRGREGGRKRGKERGRQGERKGGREGKEGRRKGELVIIPNCLNTSPYKHTN